jgi:hypothetical protein
MLGFPKASTGTKAKFETIFQNMSKIMISESTNDNLLKSALFSAHSAQKNSNHFRDNQLRHRDGTKDKVEDSLTLLNSSNE